MRFVADAHAFVWHLTRDDRLGPGAKKALDDAERGTAILVVPAIALLETLAVLQKMGRADEFPRVAARLKDSVNFSIHPLDFAVVEEAARLEKLRDLHDRAIVATARIVNAPLLTKDEEVRRSGYVRTVW